MLRLRYTFLASFLFSLHLAMVAYINSSFLSSVVGTANASVLFSASSVLSLIFIILAPRLVRRFGVHGLLIGVLMSSMSLLAVISQFAGLTVAVLFALYFSLHSLVFYLFDLYLEQYSQESNTGRIRGMYLTFNNVAWVGIPAVIGALSATYNFAALYSLAALVVFGALAVSFIKLKPIQNNSATNVSLVETFKVIRENRDLREIIILNFILQLFYVWMIIYAPLYLTGTLGFSWKETGIILSIMLIPFVLLQYPVGRLADNYLSERELIAGGFLITGLATLAFGFVPAGSSFAITAFILFSTRVGASIAEVTTESYFFKHVSAENTGIISIYRSIMPLSYLVGPAVGIVILPYGHAAIFIILSFFLIAASFLPLFLHEIRTTKQ